ncbi:hypothetical protein JTE90_018915 [Oedothorax gibbosus]|uniref:Regulator of G-protein signaling 12 n=1 Tax=Oedothorax gibbosus TaxID=931172 RepID=A0AAV6VX77_9ARAC|nr:hypothetical protein JTE90_018915 [Oedothorax gibbosus]
MHQHRRRKKRPSYGVRTVEISRGKNGFGFTISGQAPCILSCIITGSPAEKAGLRPGDFLIAVNGQNVSKAPHDDVVHLIGNSSGLLKLQIAENYYSDSSEEEFISKPKYPNKLRNRHPNSVSRAEKVVQDLQTGALFVDHITGHPVVPPQKQSSKPPGPSRTNKVLLDLILQERLQDANRKPSSMEKVKKEVKVSHPELVNNTSSSSNSEVFHSIFTEQDLNNILYPTLSQNNERAQEEAVLKAVVGYLGTIEMPKEPQLPNCRLQTIRNCIRRLRIEKKVHTLVLMSVFTESIILINPQGVTLAEFTADKITFSGVYSDDRKFFGLVTNHGTNSDEFSESSQDDASSLSISSSCHVFMVDPKLTPHHQHLKRAKAFRITCTSDPVTNKCKEFPESADNILQAVVGLYRSKLGFNNEIVHGLEFHVNMSPQPSNTSSNSSNSDSGIGFRDEGNASDRVFVVDVDNYHEYSTNSLDRRAFSNPRFGLLESTLRSFSLPQDSPLLTSKSASLSHANEINSKISPYNSNRLTVRAMPDPVGFQQNCSYAPETSEQSNINSKSGMHSLKQIREDCNDSSLNQMELSSEEKNEKLSDSNANKLSPQVYSLSFPLKTVDDVGFSNAEVESIGWECTSCSTEDLQIGSTHLTLEDNLPESNEKVNVQTLDDDSESDISEIEHESVSARKWGRTSSLRRHLGRKRSLHRSTHEAGTVSDGELASGKVSTSSSMMALDLMSDASHLSSCVSERPVDVGRVGSWAAGFNILLEDPAGLHTFSQFLKSQFSQENIAFWIACEHYRQLTDQTLMTQMAKEIYNKHLCIGAHEPVNVDSHARQIAQEGLDKPTHDLFLPAQKQIFNLMKFDCYQRFLKSSMFKECMLREMEGQPLLYHGQSCDLNSYEDEKNKVCSDLKKRKSILPWHKLSKAKSNESKNNGTRMWEKEIRKSLKKKKKKDSLRMDDNNSTQSDMTDRSSLTSSENGVGIAFKNMSSRESLNSAELTLFPTHYGSNGFYCRVILPDLSTTVVQTKKGETVGEMLLTLLERRSLTYNAVEAYLVGSNQPLDQCTDVTTLSCKEIKVQQVILFCLELPNKKTVGVKAKNNKICGDILKPVLNKYGYKIECVTMTVASTGKPVAKSAPITSIDNQRIIIKLKDPFSSDTYTADKSNKASLSKMKTTHSFPDLEELTNQIFDDLLKTRPDFNYDGLSGVDMERKNDLASSIPSKSSGMYHQTAQQKKSDTMSSKGKTIKTDSLKLPGGSKPLLPHNPLHSKLSYHDGTDSSCDANSNDFSHGKENCPVSKTDVPTSLPFDSIEDYGLATALQNLEPFSSNDLMYPTPQLSEKYFQRDCYSSTDYEETSSEKFLQNLGIIPYDTTKLKSRQQQWQGANGHSMSPPRLPPRIRQSDQKDTLPAGLSMTPDSTLIANSSFDLDLDIDVTLRAQSDDSPSKLSFSPESSQVEERSFSLLRRLSCEPPPVPPKALARGPPPRPPSRQLILNNPPFCLTSEDDLSDDGEKTDFKHNYLNLNKEYGEFNISFV